MNKTQKEMEATGEKDQSTTPVTKTGKEKLLTVCNDIIAAYKQLIVIDEAETEKLLREMTKCFVTAGSVVRRLNRTK